MPRPVGHNRSDSDGLLDACQEATVSAILAPR